MKKLLKKIFVDKKNSIDKVVVERETNRVFEQYKKSFKDLARYDRGEQIEQN